MMEQPRPDNSELVEPIELLNQVGLANAIKVSKQRINQLRHEGRLPEPYGVVNGTHPVWTQEQADQFANLRELSTEQ